MHVYMPTYMPWLLAQLVFITLYAVVQELRGDEKMTLKFEMIFVFLLYVTYIQKLGLLGDFYFFKRGTGE